MGMRMFRTLRFVEKCSGGLRDAATTDNTFFGSVRRGGELKQIDFFRESYAGPGRTPPRMAGKWWRSDGTSHSR